MPAVLVLPKAAHTQYADSVVQLLRFGVEPVQN